MLECAPGSESNKAARLSKKPIEMIAIEPFCALPSIRRYKSTELGAHEVSCNTRGKWGEADEKKASSKKESSVAGFTAATGSQTGN